MLWRYRPYLPEREHELVEILAEGRIWCPAARHFNDPFDLNPVFTHSDVPITEQVRRVQRMADQYGSNSVVLERALRSAESGFMNTQEYRRQIEDSLRQDLQTMPVLCFYPDWWSLPMWAHYATAASGFAIGIEIDGPWEERFYPLPCKYSNDRPILDLSEDLIEDGEARRRHLDHVFLTKSTVWEQEKEERVIFYGRQEGHYELPPGIVKEVCFGINSPDHQIRTAMTIARDQGAGQVVSKIRISAQTYNLERDILFQRD